MKNMSDIDKEKLLENYPIPVTIDCTEIILDQLKNSICKINNKKGKGTGFFCFIPYQNIPVMITNNHIIDEEIIKENDYIRVTLNDDKKKIDIKLDNNRKLYTNINDDITIIEIKKEIEEIKEFLTIDETTFDNNFNIYNENVYILQYPKCLEKQKAAVSYGILKKIKDNSKIIHLCSTELGSSGSPILNISNNKVLGIHVGGRHTQVGSDLKKSFLYSNYNLGKLLRNSINEFLNNINLINKNNKDIIYLTNKKDQYKEDNNIENNNEINILLKIEKNEINKDIYFLDNTNGPYIIDGKKVYHKHDNLKELNELNLEVFINKQAYKYIKYFNPEKEGNYNIKLKFKTNIKDCSFMFCNCENIINLDLSSFNTKNVTNMSYMFCNCDNLTNLNLSSFDTTNVINMRNMFFNCRNIKNLNLSILNTKNVINMSFMFCNCENITDINLSSFELTNNTDMNYMFYDCNNLKTIIIKKEIKNLILKQIKKYVKIIEI